LYFRLPQPLPIVGVDREYPSAMTFVEQARRESAPGEPASGELAAGRPKAWIDIEKPFWWDVPVWLALGQVDSIGLANNHMARDKMYPDEAWGRPRDKKRYRPPLGNGEYTQDLYYQILNAGLRIPPSAGSASGVLPNPVGYNRVYVWVDKTQFSYDAWWEGLKAGRVIVTNGPLLRPLANGRLPGHVFQVPEGEKLQIDLEGNLDWRDKISYVEVIRNGQVAVSQRLDEWSKTGHFPPLEFTESGWFLIRIVAENDKTYRFVSTGPWYVEVGERTYSSRKAVQAFIDWIDERIAQIKLADPAQQKEVLAWQERAREWWTNRLEQATAE